MASKKAPITSTSTVAAATASSTSGASVAAPEPLKSLSPAPKVAPAKVTKAAMQPAVAATAAAAAPSAPEAKPVKPAAKSAPKKPAADKSVRTALAGTGTKLSPAKDAEKARKTKLVRDSFAMPKAEYASLAFLKQRANELARPTKKSELLRAGIKALEAMNAANFLAALDSLPAIKTGRPRKD